MTILIKTPLTKFDVNNPQHRRAFYTFSIQKTWKNIPFRFDLEEDWHDVVSMITDKMLTLYMSKEFSKV